jgi:hypothetical protein
MKEHNFCPHCGVSLRGKEIPEESREFYGGATHFRREIGIQIQGVYDGVVLWKCPDCSKTWDRFEGKLAEDIKKRMDEMGVRGF